MVTRIRCTSCRAVLVSKTPVPEATVLRCPKCGASFAAELAVEPPAAEVPRYAPEPAAAPKASPPPADLGPLPPVIRTGRRKKKKRRQDSSALRHTVAACAIVLVFVGVTFGLYRMVVWAGHPRGETDKLTWEAYGKLKAGMLLSDLESQLGPAAKVAQSEVEEAFRAQDEIEGMKKTFDIESWHRWSNKSAKLFAGVHRREDAVEVAALGFINNDPATKSFASGWSVLPISAEISHGPPPSGSNTSGRVGVPRLAAFERLHPGMTTDDVIAAVGNPESVDRESSTPSGGKTTELQQWMYRADLSMYNEALPRLVAGSIGGGAAGPLSGLPFLVPRHYGWVVRFMNKRVVGVDRLERR